MHQKKKAVWHWMQIQMHFIFFKTMRYFDLVSQWVQQAVSCKKLSWKLDKTFCILCIGSPQLHQTSCIILHSWNGLLRTVTHFNSFIQLNGYCEMWNIEQLVDMHMSIAKQSKPRRKSMKPEMLHEKFISIHCT